MGSDQRPLRVTFVSADTRLLHELSWLASAVGYEVQTTKDFGPEAVWRRYANTDFIVLDGRTATEPYGAALAYDADEPVYRIFFYDPSASTDFAAWHAAGANDAIGVPVSRGELLARLRAGARYLEFERRLQSRSSKSHLPGYYSRTGFMRKLRRLAVGHERDAAQRAFLLVAIDWYEGICHRCGQAAERSIVSATARAIKRSAGENAIAAYLGEGRFATLQLGQNPAAVKSMAEKLAVEFGSRDSQRETLANPTLTLAVAPWPAELSCDKAFDRALETLAIAKQSGGDCVVESADFAAEFAAWQNELATANPFANVVAQEVMEPFPATLICDAVQTELVNAVKRSGSPVCPYVDAAGRLKGVASAEEVGPDESAADAGRYAALPISKPETISHDASFSEIYEAFSTRGCSKIVVVSGEQALGYLTFDGFLSLIDPVHAGTFSFPSGPGDESRQLIVAAACADPA
jgi:GGDEF domain-containing protein